MAFAERQRCAIWGVVRAHADRPAVDVGVPEGGPGFHLAGHGGDPVAELLEDALVDEEALGAWDRCYF